LPRARELHANDDDLSPEAQLAAVTVSSALEETKTMQMELLCGRLDDLPTAAPPGQEAWVDDLPNPFGGEWDPDECLRGLGPADRVEHLALHRRNTRRLSGESYLSRANSRSFEAAREAALNHWPDLAVFGRSDGLSHRDRGQAIADCLQTGKPFVVIEGISGVDDFFAVHGDSHWASAAIAASGRRHIATAVASGRAIAVASRDRGFLSLDASPWSPINEAVRTPELSRSRVVPLSKEITERLWFLQHLSVLELDSIYGPSGNAMILNGVVLGGIGAGFLPSGHAWNACVAPVAAAAGRTVARVDTQKRLNTGQLHNLLLRSLLRGERLPELIIARHEVAARQLVRGVRTFPA
jgi:hypothetical protein